MANQSQKLWFKKTLVITVEHYGLLQCGTKTMTKTMKNIIVISYDTHKAEAWLIPTLKELLFIEIVVSIKFSPLLF